MKYLAVAELFLAQFDYVRKGIRLNRARQI